MIDIIEAEYIQTLCHISKIVSDGKSNFMLTFVYVIFKFSIVFSWQISFNTLDKNLLYTLIYLHTKT